MEFTQAIVRLPGKSVVDGLSSADLGVPNYRLLLEQHKNYCKNLRACGLEIITLPPLEGYPDSCFVEDAAVVNPDLAVLTRPGAPSRRGESGEIAPIIHELFPKVESISPPGILDGGDILEIGNQYFVGLSERTNQEGADQFQALEERIGYNVTIVPLKDMLHLKTGVNALDEHTVLVSGEFVKSPIFSQFRCIEVSPEESYAANCININGKVIIPAAFPIITQNLRELGYDVIEISMTEFQKLDGGLSCLSIRF